MDKGGAKAERGYPGPTRGIHSPLVAKKRQVCRELTVAIVAIQKRQIRLSHVKLKRHFHFQ